ncbi:CCHC-type zinc finger nucleic acid binding protein-like [Topomyia yanbarensis]|uniref:CCHC-type zinc finger nucleic acid binding protein-like n=1 Tax=Topomyia yanbarensis TaxID=2498891 RepID=UPI00273B4569|nr:CCHC-type zinc finger nucleic acid binding protein-like [Topomyia yanbarensis]
MIRLRKGPSGTQAASVRLPVEAANKALKIGKIKVGWSVCPLSVSQRPEVCFKCQEFSHLARNCSGPDRNKLCRRCGEEGHMAKDCRQAPRCLICATEEGNNHVTGGPRCPAFKQATATKSQWS